MKNEHEGMAKAVDGAAAMILALLPKDGKRAADGRFDQAVEAKVGEIVDQAVEAMGGDANALFTVTEALTKKVPFGTRRLRSLRDASRQDKILDEASLGICELLAGDPAADFVEIGRRVDRALVLCGGLSSESDALSGLAARLQVSSQRLRQFRSAHLVAEIGGADLARLVPNAFPYCELVCLAQILQADGLMPWKKKGLIIRTADEVVRNGLEGKQISALVARMLAEIGKAESQPIIVPSWNLPPALVHGIGDKEVVTSDKVA